MKTKYLLLLSIIAVFSSCSSAYRIGQTPDDVYYSPAPVQSDYITPYNQQDKDSYAYNNNANNNNYSESPGNLSLDFGFGYSPYNYYGSPFFSPYTSFYNPYSTEVTFYPYNFNNGFYSPFNNYYSPYYDFYNPPVYYFSKPGYTAISNYNIMPRRYNLNAYNNITTNRTTVTMPVTNPSSAPVRTFRPQPNTTGVGNFIRRVISPSDNSRSNNSGGNDNSSSRTFRSDNSSGGSRSSSGGGGGGAPVRTFRH